jgi:hypothetical protein
VIDGLFVRLGLLRGFIHFFVLFLFLSFVDSSMLQRRA